MFKSDRHKQRFYNLWSKAGNPKSGDHVSALYVLSAIDKPIEKYVASQYQDEIAFDELFADYGCWSSGEKALAKLAGHLFNAGAWPVTIDDALGSLDASNRQTAFEALGIRYPHWTARDFVKELLAEQSK